MKEPFDKEEIYCAGCEHRWILISNKDITKEQHSLWIENFWKQHAQIKKEKDEND